MRNPLSLAKGRAGVWVHCAQGFNRGPSGLLAFLLLYAEHAPRACTHTCILMCMGRAACWLSSSCTPSMPPMHVSAHTCIRLSYACSRVP